MKLNLLTVLSAVGRACASSCKAILLKKRRFISTLITLVAASFLLTGCTNVHTGVLYPVGLVSSVERKLLFDALILMLIVVIPVIIMTFAFAIKYRRGKESTYTPNWAHNNWLEAVCWGVPLVIVVTLGVWAWNTTHKYDPYRVLDVPGGKPMVIQAVSLRWNWLFIYPEQHIATLNYLKLPVNRQIEFQITSDAPMNAFFIPQLASQIYAMAGMRTRLHAIASKTGKLHGFSANFSGKGFTDMNYPVYIVPQADFDHWATKMAYGHNPLTIPAYAKIAVPHVDAAAEFFSSVHPHLFQMIMNQFMLPHHNFYNRQAAKVVTGV
jgi:cytochrome o ubiquinol oxidase subunit 2